MCFSDRDRYLVLSGLYSPPDSLPKVWLTFWSLATMSMVFNSHVCSEINARASSAFLREGMLHSVNWRGDPGVLLRLHRDPNAESEYKPLLYCTSYSSPGYLDEQIIGVWEDEVISLTTEGRLLVVDKAGEENVGMLERGRIPSSSRVKGMALSEKIVTLVLDDGTFVLYRRK
jgi:hypothetical protein